MNSWAVKIQHLCSLFNFKGSTAYWKNRYIQGQNSGAGSYNQLAKFKAEVINKFLDQKKIKSIIEFGCGDGNQLTLIHYPQYIGFDVSEAAVQLCQQQFSTDMSKSFFLVEAYQNQQADLVVSLDVIYHLVEDAVFESYMNNLFAAATRFVIVYASNTDKNSFFQAKHVRHRCFTDWIEKYKKDWSLVEKIANPYPKKWGDPNTSFADFYIFERLNA